jgi:hypothetical protein
MSINIISDVCRTALACALLLTCVHASAQFVGNNSALWTNVLTNSSAR